MAIKKKILINACALTVLSLLLTGWAEYHNAAPRFNDQEIQLLGQSLTMILLASGLWAYLNAPRRLIPWWVIMLIVTPPPVFALLRGPSRHVLSYALISVAIVVIIVFRQRKWEDHHEAP